MLDSRWPTELLQPGAAAAVTALGRMPVPALLAWTAEFILFATHAKVLFGIGPDLSFDDLKGRRAYFVLDLLSPWAALAAATSCTRSGVSAGSRTLSTAVLVMCALHAAIHLFYIATWNTQHTERVISMSSTDASHRLTAGKYRAAELAWFVVGTGFDLATHLVMLRLLTSQCGGSTSQCGSRT